MAAPTAFELSSRLLRTIGVTARDGSGTFPIQTGDLDDVAGVMTAAIQEMVASGPVEIRNRDTGAWLNAPTAVTLTCTQGSATISGLTTYAAWMLGCTINIVGDGYNNELNSSTTLARPYSGPTGATTATIYADCVQLDDTVNIVLPIVQIRPQWPLIAANTREQFMQISGYPLVTDASGGGYGFPYWSFTQKAIGRPVAWFLDSFYDSTKSYLPRRLRLGPMPGEAFPLAFRVGLNPIRISTTDITTETNVPLPIPDAWVESLYYPICVKLMSGLPQFRNSAMLQEVDRRYRQAIRGMQTMGFGQGNVEQGTYI